jgi:hypothetical protein
VSGSRKAADLTAGRSANRVFENPGDQCGDGCSEGNLDGQRDEADKLAPDEHSPRLPTSRSAANSTRCRGKEKPRTRQGLSRFTHAGGRFPAPGEMWSRDRAVRMSAIRRPPPLWAEVGAAGTLSEQVDREDDTGDQHGRAQPEPEAQALLDDFAVPAQPGWGILITQLPTPGSSPGCPDS